MAGPSIAVRVLGDLTGLGKSLSDAGSKAEGTASRASSAFHGWLSGINATGVLGPLGGMLDQVDQGIQHIADHGKAIGPAMVGAGAAVTGLGAGLSAFGSKEQASHQQLQQAIANTGHAYDDYGEAIEKAIKHGENYGHTSEETQNALQRLTEATHDPAKALELLGTAENVAASRHQDLTTAATNVGKVYNGNTKLLKQFGIVLDANTGLTKDGKTATQALADVTAGQASAAQDTFKGKLDAVKAKIQDSISQFGQKYGPAVQGVGVAVMTLGTIWSTVGPIIAGMEMSTMLPILLVVGAVLALIAIGYVLWRNWDTIWSAIKGAAEAVWNWIKDHWPLLLAILLGPIGIAVDLIIKYWDNIKAGIAAAIDFIKAVWDIVVGAIVAAVGWVRDVIVSVWDGIVGFFGAIPGRVAGFFTAIWDGIKNGVNAAKDWIVDRFNDVVAWFKGLPGVIGDALKDLGNIIKAPFQWAWDEIRKIFDFIKNAAHEVLSLPGKALESIPGVGGIISHIPGLQHGGIVNVPTLAMIGEAGPEAVVPLSGLGGGGPAVVVQNATFTDQVDVDVFMQRVAWNLQRQRV